MLEILYVYCLLTYGFNLGLYYSEEEDIVQFINEGKLSTIVVVFVILFSPITVPINIIRANKLE